VEGDHRPTVQEILKDLKDRQRQQQVAQQLKDYPQTGSPEGFAVLFQENVELSIRIRKREKSISPEHYS